MLLEKPIFSVHGGFSSSLMKITGCFKAGNGHSASPRGFPAFQHPVIFIRELENPPFTEKIRFLTPFLENYTNKILILGFFKNPDLLTNPTRHTNGGVPDYIVLRGQ